MKHDFPTSAAVASFAVLAVLLAGCATQKQVSVSYLLPARALDDVHSVDVLSIDPVVRLAGNQAGAGDDARVAGLARQMLSMKLYRGGYYRVVDDIWGSMEGAAAMGPILVQQGSRHGYATLMTEPAPTKASLRLDIDLSYNVQKTTSRQTFELKTVPYIIHTPGSGNGVSDKAANALSGSGGGGTLSTILQAAQKIENLVPYSAPDEEHTTVQRVDSSWESWESGGSGRLVATIVPNGAKEPVYRREFTLSVPSSFGMDAPTLLRVAAAALAPALEEIVLDISPNTTVRHLDLNHDGDPRAVLLLEAGALSDAVEILDSIPVEEKSFGDWENLGVAREIAGDYKGAMGAYEKALVMKPEDEGLRAKMNSVSKTVMAHKALRSSGAKANADTTFRFDSSK